jgi:hypothetical protein
MGWAGHVVRMGEGEVYTESWRVNTRVFDYLENPGLDGWIIITYIFN